MKQTFIFLLLFCSIVGFAQHPVLKRDIDKHGVVNFMVFDNKSSSIPLEQAKKLLSDSLKFRSDDNLVLMNEINDKLGFTRQFYEQRYKGIKVEHGLYGVHSRNGKIEYIGGEYKKVKQVIIVPSLTEKQALQKALNFIHATKYKWENPNEENFIKLIKSDSTATNYPKGELLICKDVLYTDSIYRLAYKFDIFAETPFSHKFYSVDAITGEILNVEDLIFDSNSPGTAETRYSGKQAINTDSYSNRFRLRETRNGVRIETYNMGRTSNYSNTDFSDNDNTWTAAEYDNSNKDNAALDAHWGLERVYDYWNTVMQRNSLDNIGLPLLNYVHANLVGMGFNSNDNAFWDNGLLVMTYGDGQNTMKPVVSLDVIAHETGHGITHFTDGFGNTQENGALNEGLSDIWGAVIEHRFIPNDVNNWLIGENIMKDGTYLRSLSNPKQKNYPDTYHGMYWDNNGEVHINSTVLSHWFYLLSQGGSGINDLNNSYNVYGIGIDNAAKIVYQAQNIELRNFPNANYNVAMTQTIQAASDIYGANSPEVMQVQNAWYAVGLGTQPLQLSLTDVTYLCNGQITYFVSNFPDGYTLNWDSTPQTGIISYPLTGNPTTVTKVGNGIVRLLAKVSSTLTLTKDISVGGPFYFDINSISNLTMENYEYGSVKILPSVGNYAYEGILSLSSGEGFAASYQWALPPGYPTSTTVHWSSNGGSVDVGTKFSSTGIVLRCTSTNSCGSYYKDFRFHTDDIEPMIVSPNPASGQVDVSMEESTLTTKTLQATTNETANTMYNVSVVDSYGLTVYSGTQREKKFKISTSSLRNGIYAVIVSDGINVYQKKLVIKH